MIDYGPLAYISPQTNIRVEFIYNGSLTDETTHNLGEFSFSGYDGKHYQDKSLTTGQYAFTLKLRTEEDLREVRELFTEKATPELVGSLEHPDPTLGTFPAVVSSFRVTQGAVKGQGIITVEVVFFKTIPDLLAGNEFAQDNPASAQSAISAIDDLNASQATDLANSVDLSTGAGVAAFVQSTIAIVNNVKSSLEAITQKIDEVSIAFTDAYLDIINNVETYVNTPFELARKIQNLTQLPMLASESVTERSAAYEVMIENNEQFTPETTAEILSGSPTGKTWLANKAAASLAATSAINYSVISGQSVSIDKVKAGEPFADTGYLSRQEIADAIKFIQNQSRSTIDFFSDYAANFTAETFFNQYFDYSVLSKALVSGTVRNLNSRIFSATVEQSFITTKDTTIIQLASDLYQSVELSAIEFVQQSNKIFGDKIFLVPKGTEIRYY